MRYANYMLATLLFLCGCGGEGGVANKSQPPATVAAPGGNPAGKLHATSDAALQGNPAGKPQATSDAARGGNPAGKPQATSEQLILGNWQTDDGTGDRVEFSNDGTMQFVTSSEKIRANTN
jgi:hypothetical protein